MIANKYALEILLSVTPSIEKCQELLLLGRKKEIKSEYWQGVYDLFVAMNNSMNSNLESPNAD